VVILRIKCLRGEKTVGLKNHLKNHQSTGGTTERAWELAPLQVHFFDCNGQDIIAVEFKDGL
jgi:hypothetical protein